VRPVSRTDPLPLYRQVEADLRERITSGGLAPGQRLPSETELATLYSASKITLRQALANLAADGLIERRAGKGTFVRAATLTAGSRTVTSFTDELAALKLRAGARVLRLATEGADALTAERLRIEPGTRVVALDRLRLGDGTPIGIQRARLIAELVPGLEDLDLSEGSLYALLASRFGLVPTEAEESFHVGPARREEARLLEVPERSCCFLVERVTFAGGRPFEFVRSLMRGDRYQVRLGLRATGG
jgi:GntR family transcriptional regulator